MPRSLWKSGLSQPARSERSESNASRNAGRNSNRFCPGAHLLSTRVGERGFTLVEIMVVISIIVILLSMALPIYSRSLKRAREDVLRKNLHTLNELIDEYTLDKQKAPKSLNDLVSAGYLKREIPQDITGRSDTWVVDEDDSIRSLYQKEGGVVAVHSGSNQTAIDGTAYSTW